MTNRAHCRTSLLAAAAVVMSLCHMPALAAAPEDEVRAAFDQFVTAQNAHDLKAVEASLLAAPEFLWITRGTAVWGHEAALKRFAALYGGTWRLEPETSNLKVIMLGQEVARQLGIRPRFARTISIVSCTRPPFVTTSSTIRIFSSGEILNPRRNASLPSSFSTNMNRIPNCRATSWPSTNPPIAGETTVTAPSPRTERARPGACASTSRAAIASQNR